MSFMNYDQILQDFVTAITAANLGFVKVLKDASDFDFHEANMPLADCRWKRVIPDNTAGQNYYCDGLLEVEIACFNMTSRASCCKMRNDLTNASRTMCVVTRGSAGTWIRPLSAPWTSRLVRQKPKASSSPLP
jgi:hypothetical protein